MGYKIWGLGGEWGLLKGEKKYIQKGEKTVVWKARRRGNQRLKQKGNGRVKQSVVGGNYQKNKGDKLGEGGGGPYWEGLKKSRINHILKEKIATRRR